MQHFPDKSRSGIVTIPKQFLDRDDVLQDGEIPEEHQLVVDRLGHRTYSVRLVDCGSVPELEECDMIQQLVAQQILR